MERNLILIAGGSGSGKSTLAIGLLSHHPEQYALLHLDDYYKTSEEAPKLPDGKPNWDDPEAIHFDRLVSDVRSLLQGNEVEVLTKSELYNPAYDPGLKNKISHAIQPKPTILLEGYLALHDERLRELASCSIYLDMPIEHSVRRRSRNKFKAPEDYFDLVLVPIHHAFVKPSAQHADIVIDVSGRSEQEVLEIAETEIARRAPVLRA